MLSMLEDRRPIEFLLTSPIRDNTQHIHIRQSPIISSDYPVSNMIFPASHTTQLAELLPQQSVYYRPEAVDTAPQAYPSFALRPLYNSSQAIAPRPTQSHDFNNISRSSSICMSLGFNTTRAPNPVSLDPRPGYWSFAVSQQCLYQQAARKESGCNSLHDLHLESPIT